MWLRRIWSGHKPELLVVGTFFLLGLAWIVSNPPGAAADEPSHYVRMVGLSEGHLIGAALREGEGPQPGDAGFQRPTINFDRLRTEAGRYSVPGSAPPPNGCNRVAPRKPYDCPPTPPVAGRIDAISLHARTMPGSYVFPALLSRFSHTTNGKLALGRLAYLLQDTALFAVAVALGTRLLRGSRREVYLALLLAFPPLLMFQMGSLSPDGTEAMAVLAFAAMLLALVREPSRSRFWWSVILALITLWVRDLGIAYMPAIALVVGIASRRRLGAVARSLRRVDLAGIALLAAGVIGAAVWRITLLYNVKDLRITGSRLRPFLESLRIGALASFGRVGWHDVPSDWLLNRLWLGAFTAIAVTLGVRRRAWTATAGAVALFYLLLNAYLWLYVTAVGYFNQERYTVILAAVGLLVASALFPLPGPSGRFAAAMEVPIVAVAAAGHFSVFLINAQRHAHGRVGFREIRYRVKTLARQQRVDRGFGGGGKTAA